jgi:hypothetical protein
MKVETLRVKRRFRGFFNHREWVTIAVRFWAFKRVFENSCLPGYHWIHTFGENYATYAERFNKEKIDGYGLYRLVFNKTLIEFGVGNEDHRRKILDGIEQLKKDHLNKH